MDEIVALASGAGHTLAGASLVALAIAVALHLAKVAAEARSWHGIVSHAYPETDVRFRTTYGAFAGAIGANAVLPARVGEALRLGIVRGRVPGSTVATIAGTVVLEAVIEAAFGVAVVVAVLVAGRPIGHLGSPTAVLASHPAAIVIAGAGAAVLAAIGWALRRRLSGIATALAHGMSIVRSPGPLLRTVLVWKVVAWTLRLAAVYAFLLAFHVGGGLWIVLVVVAAQNLAGLLPLAPGSAGTQQAALAVALAGTVSLGAIVGFGVGFQVATGLSDLVAGAVAVALLSSWSSVGEAIRPSLRKVAAA